MIRLIAIAAFGAVLTLSSMYAFSSYGEFTSVAEIGFASTCPATVRTAIVDALQSDGVEFIKGSYVNSSEGMYFNGSAESLSVMLGKLCQCDQTTVSVLFVKLDTEAAWMISRNAFANAICVRVNLNSDQVSLEKLILPEFRRTETGDNNKDGG
jgi:hypothetical protein